MLNLGIARCHKRVLRQLDKVIKEQGINIKDVGMVRITIEQDDAMNRPGAFLVVDSLDAKRLKKIPLREALPKGWHIKKPLLKRLKEWWGKFRTTL